MLVYSSLPIYMLALALCIYNIIFTRGKGCSLQEWEAQVCLMSQRIPASAGLERKNVIINLLSRRGHSLCTKELDFLREERKDAKNWPSLFTAWNEIDANAGIKAFYPNIWHFADLLLRQWCKFAQSCCADFTRLILFQDLLWRFLW